MGFCFWIFYRGLNGERWWRMVLTGIVIFFSLHVLSLGIRSQEMGLLFFVLLWRWPRWAPLILLLWANTHGSFVLGLVLLPFLLLSQTGDGKKKALVFLLSLLATFLTPFGSQLYVAVWRHFAGLDLSLLIAEWQTTPLWLWPIIGGTSLAAALVFVRSHASLNSPKFLKPPIAMVLALLPFAFLALRAQRHTPFFFLLSLSLLSCYRPKFSLGFLVVPLATSFLLLSLILRWPVALVTNADYCQTSSLNYPCAAIGFLKKQPDKGLIFNRYEWGGFLIWQLPEFPIFVDGRMPAWPTPVNKSPYTIYLETLQTQPGWQETLRAYNLNWILISPGVFLDLLLQPDPAKYGWQEIYRDKISVIYRRN